MHFIHVLQKKFQNILKFSNAKYNIYLLFHCNMQQKNYIVLIFILYSMHLLPNNSKFAKISKEKKILIEIISRK